ncbi:MAG: hypothetical protein MUF42_17025 [Cytophagaceae bacterium]|jgi:hypothetical protein|nr:hypothetical protein [Cytophagaceae bacterium]
MSKPSKNDFNYYLLALLGLLLILIPFFFLKTETKTTATLQRLSFHMLAVGAAAVSATAIKTALKASSKATLLKIGTYSLATVSTAALVVGTMQLQNNVMPDETALTADSVSVSASNIMDTTTTVATETNSLAAMEEVYTPDVTEQSAPSTSSSQNKKELPRTQVSKETRSTTEAGAQACSEQDIGVFVAGKKMDLKAGIGLSNAYKNMRIGDHCGCTSLNTLITISDASGRKKAEKKITTPFFVLSQISQLDSTDQVLAEISELTCVNKEGIKSQKKINRIFLKFFMKHDHEGIQRKRAAKELFVQEEINPTGGSKSDILNKASNNKPAQKDKVEEEYNRYE